MMPNRISRAWTRPVAAMALLGLLAACGGTTPQGPATRGSFSQAARSYDPPGPASDPWGPYIREASRRFDVPERWIREVMRQESGGRVTATSPVGAMGLMQVMPGTYRELRARHSLGDDPYHPYDSLMAGTAYIRQMYDLYGSPAFLAAYNAGPRRLEDYLYSNRGLPAETRNYVARVGPGVIRASPVRRAPQEVYAAAEIPLSVPQGPRRMDANTRMALAEQRSLREQNAQFASTPAAEPSAAPMRMASAAPLPPVSSRARGGVVAMEPIPDGSTPEGAIRMAESAARQSGESSFERMPDGSILAGRMEPIPDGSTPEGAARLAGTVSRSEAPMVLAARPSLVPAPSPRSALVALSPPSSSARNFGFIGTAQAGTLPASFRPALASSGGDWAVQVGAFASSELARNAASSAQGNVGGRAQVMPVQVGRSTLFRARVTGLTQASAQQACDRLRRNGACTVVQ